MSRLRIYDDAAPDAALAEYHEHAAISRELAAAGIRFEQWQASQPIAPGASQDEVIAAYRSDIDRLMASEGYHEEGLSPRVQDHHRAIASIMEEFEAVDWYDQRVEATSDAELAEILAHNRDEEKEHAAMTLEWLRRRDPQLDEQLRTYLFTSGSILAVEDAATAEGEGDGEGGAGGSDGGAASPPSTDGSLGISSLRDAPSL